MSSSYWRVAGMNYLQYLTKCTTRARLAVKESVRPKYEAREQFHFIKQVFTQGKVSEKTIVSNVVKP